MTTDEMADTVPHYVGEDKIVPVKTDLVSLALERGAGIDVVERVAALVERRAQSEAEKLFNEAMTTCQSEMPVIVHDSQNTFLKASYAKLEAIQHTCKPIYTRHGFALSWAEDDTVKPGYVRVICDVRHKGGHKERYHGDYPLDGTGAKGGSNMNPLQGRVSSNTYAQRDMLRSIFNITIAGKDLDGNNPTDLSEGDLDKLAELWKAAEQACVDAGVPKSSWDKYAAWFLKWMEVEKLDAIHPAKFQSASLELVRKAREPK